MLRQPHTFHIPVMGTGFTIDTPLRVAQFGISSVISLVDDVLIEQVRQYHSLKNGEPYSPIDGGDEDSRARRITEYLNLLDRLIRRQMEGLRRSSFEKGGEIRRYYDLLPDGRLKQQFFKMLKTADPEQKAELQEDLRQLVKPGSIDVNIMTKVDRDAYRAGKKLPPEFADALSALRGFAQSALRSSIIFSAGINQRLYSYAGQFDDFSQDESGQLRKKIILKVSDYRSAEIQGKFLAKRGLWVSEFRIESGLNCGGHAFATQGHLLGPVLEEFKSKRSELTEKLFNIFRKSQADAGRPTPVNPPETRLTVQGGIGTADENEFLLNYYQFDGTGWGTPFMLVPEVTVMDEDHRQKLLAAREEDVYLSDCSPLGIPFWNLRSSASEQARQRRIDEGNPGSECPKRFAALNSEFSKIPQCIASRQYLTRKLEALAEEDLTPEQKFELKESALQKACLCHDLAGGVTRHYGIDPEAAPAITCGPNILNFSKIASLDEMVSHIYGRISLLTNSDRPQIFIQELKLYIEHLQKEIRAHSLDLSQRPKAYFDKFKTNLQTGIEYYRGLARQVFDENRARFLEELKALQQELELLPVPVAVKS